MKHCGAFWRGSALIEPVDTALELIQRLASDIPAIFDRLVNDDRILEWQRGSLLLYHRPMREHLEQILQTGPQQSHYVSLVVAALKYEQHPGVVDVVVNWLRAIPEDIHFPAAIQKDPSKRSGTILGRPFSRQPGVMQMGRERNLFLAVEHLGGKEALDALVQGSVLPPSRLGALF